MSITLERVSDHLIIPLDVPDIDAAQSLVRAIGDAGTFYKIGLELAMTPDYFRLLDWLLARDCKVFCDLKLHDIPATVGRAVARLADSGAHLLTVHAGQAAMLEQAIANAGEQLKLLAVTVLTSIDQDDLRALGINKTPEQAVFDAAERALDAGVHGLVSSGQEIAPMRQRFGNAFVSVTPGIRPAGAQAGDQKRVMTPTDAIRAGATHLVVGRPIRDAASPGAAAAAIQTEIRAALASRELTA